MSDPQRASRIEFIGKWAILDVSRLDPFFARPVDTVVVVAISVCIGSQHD